MAGSECLHYQRLLTRKLARGGLPDPILQNLTNATQKRVMLDLSTFRSTAEERKGEDDPKAE
jgi:hypothetical protein